MGQGRVTVFPSDFPCLSLTLGRWPSSLAWVPLAVEMGEVGGELA